jgi:predicted P-loop ATPase
LSPTKIPDECLLEKNGPTKLIHMVFSIAKNSSNAPVVIFLNECEKFFQSTKNKKSVFQKDLLIYKNQGIAKERVIIIGSSDCPWNADLKLLKWKGISGKPEKQGTTFITTLNILNHIIMGTSNIAVANIRIF